MKKCIFLLASLVLLFTSCKDDDNEETPVLPEDSVSLSIEVVTNKPTNTIQLSLSGSNPVIDWGDGQTDKLDGTSSHLLSHTYESSAQQYTVSVKDAKLQAFGIEKDEDNIVKYVKFVDSPILKFVRLLDVQSINSLDFSDVPALQELYITNSALTSLDLTSKESLQSVKLLHNSKLADLKLSSTIKTLGLDTNPKLLVSSISLPQLISLQELLLYGMNLTSLDLSANIAVSTLDVSSNSLTTIDISKLANLEIFKSNDNPLTGITLGAANAKLKNLESTYTQLDAAALDAIFTALPTRSVDDSAVIDITGNPGAGQVNVDLASEKNWEVLK